MGRGANRGERGQLSGGDQTAPMLTVIVDRDGTVRLPREIRARYGIKKGDEVTIRAGETGILVQTLDQRIKAAQEYFRSIVPHEVCLSDELIAERRREAAAEEREFRRDCRKARATALPPKPRK